MYKWKYDCRSFAKIYSSLFSTKVEFSSRSLAIVGVSLHTIRNGIASAVNDEAGSNSVDGVK